MFSIPKNCNSSCSNFSLVQFLSLRLTPILLFLIHDSENPNSGVNLTLTSNS